MIMVRDFIPHHYTYDLFVFNMTNSFIIHLGSRQYRFHMLSPLTALYFKSFIPTSVNQIQNDILDLLPVDKAHLKEETDRLKDPFFAEYSLLIESVANAVLPLNQFFFHGAAFIWKESAYLFTGKSGIGKTTQLVNWMNLFPDEIEIINGDKPLIEIKDDKFNVHPSPWGGKEGFRGYKNAELKGIILLEQGDTDQISRLSIKDAVFPLFLQFLYKPDDLQSVDLVCQYEEKLLSSVPVWKLVNRGTEESALLTHSFLTQEVSR